MKIDTTELYESIATLERLSMEQERADTFDLADDQGQREDQAYAESVAVEQYDMLAQALDEALAKGVSVENLRILVRETGMTQWGISNSLVRPQQAKSWFKD